MARKRVSAQINRAVAGGYDQPKAPQSKDDEPGIIPLPHGLKAGKLSDFIDPENRPELKTSVLGNPERFLKDPKPDHMYVWKIAKGGRKHEDTDPNLAQGIRTGKYRPVQIDEVKDDADLPMTVMNLFKSSAGNTDVVAVLDLALVELTPKAVKEDYKWREQQAAMRTMHLTEHIEQKFAAAARNEGIQGVGDYVKMSVTEQE